MSVNVPISGCIPSFVTCATITPLYHQIDCHASFPLLFGNYSGCTKNITKLEKLKNNPLLLPGVIEIGLCIILMLLQTLPVFVLLPMEGGHTNTRELKKSVVRTQNKEKRTQCETNGGERDDNHGTKKPERTGRPNSTSSYVCNDCNVCSQYGSHQCLHEYHRSAQMRHPGVNFRAMSDYASYGGITISLNPDIAAFVKTVTGITTETLQNLGGIGDTRK